MLIGSHLAAPAARRSTPLPWTDNGPRSEEHPHSSSSSFFLSSLQPSERKSIENGKEERAKSRGRRDEWVRYSLLEVTCKTSRARSILADRARLACGCGFLSVPHFFGNIPRGGGKPPIAVLPFLFLRFLLSAEGTA